MPSTGLASSVVRDTTLEGDGVKPPHHRLTNLVTRRAASARRPLSIRPYRRGHILYSASLALGPIATTRVVAGFLHRPNLAADSAASAHMQAGTHSSSLDGTGAHTRRRERQLTVRGYTHMNHPPLLRQFTGLVAVVPSTGLASLVVHDTSSAGDGVKPPHHRMP